MRLQVGTQLGSYDVLGLLGVGGMGEVYAARDTRLGRRVALKVLPERFASDPERLERFKREAQVLAALNHPNIGAIHGVEDSDAVQALVLELIEGPTLADRLARGPIPPAEALPLARQIASALESAHEQGIIHRDLKPSNIKLRPDGTVKVLDFGLAKALDPAPAGTAPHEDTITMPMDRVVGTAAYMSPEQARGQAVDKRADIWAFGCVLYEMLTGRRPFGRGDTAETIAAVIGVEPDWATLPRGVSPVLQACLRACLRKDPKQRVHDIGDVRLTLEGAFDSTSLEPGTTPDTRPTRWRRTLGWVTALVAVAVATAMTAWRLKPAIDERPVAFDIHAPDGTQFHRATMHPMPALSRDGRHLAFVAPMEAPALWVQTIGDPRARRLPGTENASFPFWSPDAAFVGFTANGRLRKVAVSEDGDRAPRDLCSCNAVFGATWSANDTIVFAGRDGLERVPAGGGQPKVVTRFDASRGEYSHRFPVLLPDGREFLYLVRSTQDDHRGLYLGSLDDPPLKQRLIPDDSNGAYGLGPDGSLRLFFVRDPDLLTQQLDLTRREVAGDAIVVAAHVIPGSAGRLAPFAAGNRTLVYLQSSIAETRLRWMDRHGTPGPIVGAPGVEYAFPALSPDGTRLAVTRRDARTGKRDIWLRNLEQGIDERLTEDPIAAHFPLWTADASRIVFGTPVAERWDVFWQWANGTKGDKLLFHPPPSGPAEAPSVIRDGFLRDITRDGRFLLYGGNRELWVQPLDGTSQPYRLLTADHGRVSPDGRWLAYTSNERGEHEIYVTNFPQPTRRWRVSSAGGRDPQWSKDGKELYYVAADRTLVVVAVEDAVRKGSFDGLVRQVLFHAAFDDFSMTFGSVFAPAPDGRRFLIVENVHDKEMSLNVTINWTPGPAGR